MKSFAAVSLRWQVLLAPLLLILAILVIEVMNYRQETGVDAATTRLFSETVRRLTALDEADAFALEINGRMFRAMTLVQNGAPPKIVRTLVDTLPGDLDKLGDELSAVAKRAGENGHAVEAAKIADLSVKYRKSGNQFSKVLFVDSSVAVDYATSAGVFFQDLHGILRTLSKSYDEASATEFAGMKAGAAAAVRLSWIGGLCAVVGGLVVSLWLARSLTAPLVELTRVMAALARADWSATVPYASRGDEVGRMARAVNVFRDNGVENERLKRIEEEGRLRAVSQQAAELERDRTEQARLAREAERARMVSDVTERFDATAHKVLGTFAQAFGNLQETAATMGSAADATRTRADGVSQAAVEASNNVQTIAASIEELGESIAEISEQVSASSSMAAIATGDADQLNNTLQSVNSAAKRNRFRARFHQVGCQPHQLAGAERHHRGGACRARRPGIRGRRQRGEGAGDPDQAGDRRCHVQGRTHPDAVRRRRQRRDFDRRNHSLAEHEFRFHFQRGREVKAPRCATSANQCSRQPTLRGGSAIKSRKSRAPPPRPSKPPRGAACFR